MYAVIKVGGKQYKVEQGQKLLVDRQPHEPGKSFTPPVLMTGGDEVVTDGTKLGVEMALIANALGVPPKTMTAAVTVPAVVWTFPAAVPIHSPRLATPTVAASTTPIIKPASMTSRNTMSRLASMNYSAITTPCAVSE